MSEERDDQERPCLHCMMVELIDDFFAEYPSHLLLPFSCQRQVTAPDLSSADLATREHPPHHKDDNGADHRADKSGPFAGLVPSDGLPEISSNEGTRYSEDVVTMKPDGSFGPG